VGSGTLNQDSIAGKLTFDATAFATAFANDPLSVKNLVGGSLSVQGFAQGFQGILNPVVQAGGTLDQRISSEGDTLKSIADRIADMDVQLQQKQDLLTRQFTNMETALTQSQSEGQWLQGQLAGLH
jgi:flagellar hook-associated protein 2